MPQHGNVDEAGALDHVVRVDPTPHLVKLVAVGEIRPSALIRRRVLPVDLCAADDAGKNNQP